MPRPKLIYHGLYEGRSPITGYYGEPMWAPVTEDYRHCPHPRWALRFDPRDSVPTRTYCRACGLGNIHPHHGLTEEEVAGAKKRALELALQLGMAREIHLPRVLADGFGISTSEARRCIAQGAVRINDEIVESLDGVIWGGDVVRLGKRRFFGYEVTEADGSDH